MMTYAERASLLEQILDKSLTALAYCRPGTDEYRNLVKGIDVLDWLSIRNRDRAWEIESGKVGLSPESEVVDGTVGHPDPVGEPGEPGVPGDDDVTGEKGDSPGDPGPEREPIVPEDLRAELSDAKKKGVVISDLINSLGAKNFSALKDDQDKLCELKGLLDKALKELHV